MSYQQKLAEARALLEAHNSQLPAEVKSGVDVDQFFKKLAEAGGTNDAALSQCAWEDLMDFGIPKLLARQVAQVFRKADKPEDNKPVVHKRSHVEAMTVGQLLAIFDPRQVRSLAGKRLEEIVGTKRCLVFNVDNTLNIAASEKLIHEITEGYDERELFPVDGVPMKVYRLGERPDQVFDENPLYPGRALRPDGDCDQLNRSWNDVSPTVRAVIHLAVTQTKEVKIASINDAHNILDLVVGKSEADAIKVVRQRFSKASALYAELAKQGRAPLLKIWKKSAEKVNDPFGTHKTY